jgi:hypothetical protein
MITNSRDLRCSLVKSNGWEKTWEHMTKSRLIYRSLGMSRSREFTVEPSGTGYSGLIREDKHPVDLRLDARVTPESPSLFFDTDKHALTQSSRHSSSSDDERFRFQNLHRIRKRYSTRLIALVICFRSYDNPYTTHNILVNLSSSFLLFPRFKEARDVLNLRILKCHKKLTPSRY